MSIWSALLTFLALLAWFIYWIWSLAEGVNSVEAFVKTQDEKHAYRKLNDE